MATVVDTSVVRAAIPASGTRENVIAILRKYSKHSRSLKTIKDDRKIYIDLWICGQDLRNAMHELENTYGLFGEGRIPDYRALGDKTIGELVEIIKEMRGESSR